MSRVRVRMSLRLSVLLVCTSIAMWAKQSADTAVVPPLVKFSGVLVDGNGKPLTGTVGVTFLLYKEQTGGAPLWMETQNVHADQNGHYSVMLGSSTSYGLPQEAFATGEARWLAVQPSGQAESPRVELASVPYALKALDAQTLGGRPASAYLVTPPVGTKASQQQGAAAEQANEIVCFSGTACKTGFVPLFSSNGGSAKVSDSIVSQNSSNLTINGNLSTTGSVSGGGASFSGPYGVLGNNVSSSNFAAGVLGQNLSSRGITLGVEGISHSSINGPRGIGVLGVNTKRSNTAGLEMGNNPVGVWGDTGSFGVGVEATADEGYALAATNNSATGSFTGTFDNLQSSAHNLNVLVAEGAFGFCAQDTDGNLGCSGTKSAIVPVDNGLRQVALYAVEAPQNWFEDFGSGQLSNGSATVSLDPTFAQTVNAASDYHVFLTAEGNCEGLYVSQKNSTSFEVHELRNGRSNVAFDYRIVALRKGYEQVRLGDKTRQWKQLLEHQAKVRGTGGPRLPVPVPLP